MYINISFFLATFATWVLQGKNVQCAPSKCRSELAEGDRSSNQFPLRISIDIVSWDSRLTFQQAKLNVNKPFLADQTTLILGKKALRAAMFSG